MVIKVEVELTSIFLKPFRLLLQDRNEAKCRMAESPYDLCRDIFFHNDIHEHTIIICEVIKTTVIVLTNS